jgi:hypothetical protein
MAAIGMRLVRCDLQRSGGTSRVVHSPAVRRAWTRSQNRTEAGFMSLRQKGSKQHLRARSFAVAIGHDSRGLGRVEMLPEGGFAGASPGFGHGSSDLLIGGEKTHNILN